MIQNSIVVKMYTMKNRFPSYSCFQATQLPYPHQPVITSIFVFFIYLLSVKMIAYYTHYSVHFPFNISQG